MNKKRIIAVALVMGVLFGGSIAVSAAGENYIPFTFSTLESGEETVEGLNSIGRIQGKESEMAEPSVILDSTDLVILAKAANQLNTQFTMALADAVKGIGSDISIQDENNYSSIIETINGIEERQGGTFDTSNMTESGTIGQEDYEASLVIPLEKGYYPDGSQVTVNLTDNNKSYYNLGYANGLAKIDNASIIYTYHSHVGDAQNGGECYSPLYKVHSHSNGCYSTVSSTCTCSAYAGQWINDTIFICRVCGHAGHGPGGTCGATTTSTVLSCGKIEGTRYQSEGLEAYVISCGKTESTIETATIVFN
jgi:hypothetical protein